MTAPDLTERQAAIVRLVKARGFATIDGLSEAFGVSAQTVRRDIIALDANGVLQRFHGGVGNTRQGERLRLGYEEKRRAAPSAKTRIAEQVARIVPSGASLYLDVGTTCERAAEALNALDGLRVVTNSTRAAARFDHGRHCVHVLGGTVAGQDGSLVGEETAVRLAGLRLDYALIGCSGVEASGAVMDFDVRKVAIKRVALTVARTAMLLAAAEKFGRSAHAEIAQLDAFAHVIDGSASEPASGARAKASL